jgi:hypothetical protein
MKRLALALAVGAFAAPTLAAEKTYQVTGPVVDVTDSSIVVKKGNENWELARTPDTKVTGELKKGDKVTVRYTMTATSIEAKPAAAKPAGTKTKK